MKIRTAITALLLGLSGACAGTSTSDETEASSRPLVERREHLTVIQYNIAGATRSRGQFPIIDRIVEEVMARQPDILSLNEICSNQYAHLVERLQQSGYPMESHYHLALGINPTCGTAASDGNAVFVRGEVLRRDKYFFDASRNQRLTEGANGIGVVRSHSVACVTARFNDPGAPVKVCATHLSKRGGHPDPLRVPRLQVLELYRVFGAEAQQMPFVLAGDLNLPIHSDILDALYNPTFLGDVGAFSEIATTVVYEDDGAGERRAAPTHHEEKLDYVFVSKHFAPDVGLSGVAEHSGCRETPCSDHRMLFGGFRWVGSLKVLNSQMCLVARAGPGERPVVQVPCADFSDQAWIFRYLDGAPGPEGPVQVINRDRDLCLVTRGMHESAALVSTCDAGFADQVWNAVRDPNTGYYQLKNRNSGLCLVVRTNNPETRATQSTCGTQWADQLWLWDAWFK